MVQFDLIIVESEASSQQLRFTNSGGFTSNGPNHYARKQDLNIVNGIVKFDLTSVTLASQINNFDIKLYDSDGNDGVFLQFYQAVGNDGKMWAYYGSAQQSLIATWSLDDIKTVEIRFDCNNNRYTVLIDDSVIGSYPFQTDISTVYGFIFEHTSISITPNEQSIDNVEITNIKEVMDGVYDLEQSEPDESIYKFVHGVDHDLNKVIDVSWTTNGSHEKLNDLIDTYCDFIEGTIADDSYADWSYIVKDKKISEIIHDIMNRELKLFRISRSKDATFIGTPLGGAADLTINNTNMGDPRIDNISYAITKVKLTGKWYESDYLRAEWNSTEADTPSQNILSDDCPNIQSQADLQIQANQIGDQTKNQVQRITTEVYESLFYEYGSVVEVCYGIKGIGTDNADGTPLTYDKYIISKCAENEYGEMVLELLSAFVFTSKKNKEDNISTTNGERISSYADSISNGGEGGSININDVFKVGSDGKVDADIDMDTYNIDFDSISIERKSYGLQIGNTIWMKSGYTQSDLEDALTAITATGGDVHLAEGVCDITSNISLPAYCNIWGNKNTILENSCGSGIYIMNMGNYSGIYGIRITDLNDTNRLGIYVGSYCIIDHCWFYWTINDDASLDYAIVLVGSHNRIVHCINNGGGIFCWVGTASSYNYIAGNWCVNAYHTVRMNLNNKYNQVLGNQSYSAGSYAIYLKTTCGDNSIIGNTGYGSLATVRIDSGSTYNVVIGNTKDGVSNAGAHNLVGYNP